mgnify:CR=1 FL=1
MGFHVICECVFRKRGLNMTNGSEKQLTRRQRERLAHMNEVLEAAEECFLQKGYRDATIEDIARKADFAVGSIYTFYKNKEELLCHVVLRIANKQIDDFNECVMPLLENPIEALPSVRRRGIDWEYLQIEYLQNLPEGFQRGKTGFLRR